MNNLNFITHLGEGEFGYARLRDKNGVLNLHIYQNKIKCDNIKAQIKALDEITSGVHVSIADSRFCAFSEFFHFWHAWHASGPIDFIIPKTFKNYNELEKAVRSLKGDLDVLVYEDIEEGDCADCEQSTKALLESIDLIHVTLHLMSIMCKEQVNVHNGKQSPHPKFYTVEKFADHVGAMLDLLIKNIEEKHNLK